METRKLHELANALESLHQWRVTGEHAPELTAEMQHALLADRYIHLDEYGEIRITERGEEHLRHLKSEGRLLKHGHHDRNESEPDHSTPKFL